MNIKEKEDIRLAILGTIEELKKNIKIFKRLSQPVSPDNAIGRITRMEAINSKSMNEASLVKSTHRLTRLQRSLGMLDDPDFGYCINCEEPIPYKRLLILPETSLCVPCAQKLNQG